jgi:hypothetical protein
MGKSIRVATGIIVALCIPGLASGQLFGPLEVTGEIKAETSMIVTDGLFNGEALNQLQTEPEHATAYKFETSGRLFVNGDLLDSLASYHLEFRPIYDVQGIKGRWRGYRAWSQHDWLREIYIDSAVGPVDFRLGKQQLVWGRADGIKLLDIINPTDYREFNQNTFEESRIPVVMLKGEMFVGDTGSIEGVVSQRRENVIPGLNASGDAGHPFIFKGVDSITGPVNGFLNIAPNLAGVAQNFHNFAAAGAFPTPIGPSTSLAPFTGLTVDGFSSTPVQLDPASGQILFPNDPRFDPTQPALDGFRVLNAITQDGLNAFLPEGQEVDDPNANNFETRLMSVIGPDVFQDAIWDPSSAGSAFEYQPNATFSTFNTFAGATSEYLRDYPDKTEPNFGARYRDTFGLDFNWSLNYLYAYDPNPSVSTSWRDPNTGENLEVLRARPGAFGLPDPNNTVSADEVPNVIAPDGSNTVTMLLRNSAGDYYGVFDPTTGQLNDNQTKPVLRFTEELNRVHNIGASFDKGFTFGKIPPVVLRGEFLYQIDTRVPVVDKRLLAIGDLSNGLRTEKTDMFKYVLGADIIVARNLTVSGQFIQFVDLDFRNRGRSCQTQTGIQFDCSAYTADAAVLSLTNGLKKQEEFKEFYSLFFSKPFGPEQQGRWNNITIFEDEGGIWNRFDVEYGFTDRLLGSLEFNWYGGDPNSLFGQFNNSSNFQVGVKYLFY